jgi:NAD(P)H-dependent FMN reductase
MADMPSNPPPRLLAFAGSARRASYNRQLLAVAVAAAQAAGATVTVLDLNEFVLPLYHGDLEDAEGQPEAAQRLVALIAAHDALLIASPEYNSQITPLLKNTLDWCSRADDDPFPGKVGAVISASPGPYGAIRSAAMAHQLLDRLGVLVIPATCNLIKAGEAFDETGQLKSERTLQQIRQVVQALVDAAQRQPR